MTFECIDIEICDCQTHVSWDTHVATCTGCHGLLRKRTPGAPIVDSGDSTGWCVRCDTTWVLPKPHPDTERNWHWAPRTAFDYTDLLPLGERAFSSEELASLGERAEMGANAEPAEPDLEERRR